MGLSSHHPLCSHIISYMCCQITAMFGVTKASTVHLWHHNFFGSQLVKRIMCCLYFLGVLIIWQYLSWTLLCYQNRHGNFTFYNMGPWKGPEATLHVGRFEKLGTIRIQRITLQSSLWCFIRREWEREESSNLASWRLFTHCWRQAWSIDSWFSVGGKVTVSETRI